MHLTDSLIVNLLTYYSRLASILAIEFIIAASASYELIEWFVAVVFTPKWADQFLGQQGDIFDAQKDMALATTGAILSISGLAARNSGHHNQFVVPREATDQNDENRG